MKSAGISILATLTLLLACGGRVGDSAAEPDASTNDGGVGAVDGGWTQCTSPSGVAVCNGPASCATSGPACPNGCPTPVGMSPALVNICIGTDNEDSRPCDEMCADGQVCVQVYTPGAFFCEPIDVAILYAKNGSPDRARYADMGKWTGDAVPAPDTCPIVQGLTICGGNCGGCSPGEVCTGRAPLHPYGFCTPPDVHGCQRGKHSCDDPSLSCFTFTVQPEVQGDANDYGLCIPSALCQAIAANLPGGGTCARM